MDKEAKLVDDSIERPPLFPIPLVDRARVQLS